MEKKTNPKVHADSHGTNVIPFKARPTPIVEEETVSIVVCGLCHGNTFHLIGEGEEDEGKIACSTCGYKIGSEWKIK